MDRTPVWFMRQAGRALPEYRQLRGEGSILDAIADPDLASEITMQPVRRYGVDAAILFSDIVVPLAAIGFGVEITPGRGPVVERPFRSAADLARLRPLEPDTDVPYLRETVGRLVEGLEGVGVPLIGFAGAPFTLASYLIEGGPTRDFVRTKALMLGEPDLWDRLLDALATLSLGFLQAQVAAGAAAVQLFDSWAGALAADDYERSVLPHSRKVLEGVAGTGVPRIHFGVGTGHLLELMAAAGADVVGVDWRVPLGEARRRVGLRPDGVGRTVQGNLDPAACVAGWPVTEKLVHRVLDQAGPEPGHVFNLGHGVLPETDPTVLERVVELVHSETAR